MKRGNMKSRFEKWEEKFLQSPEHYSIPYTQAAWNAALTKTISLIQRRNKIFEGSWQHEDIDYLIEDLKRMIQK